MSAVEGESALERVSVKQSSTVISINSDFQCITSHKHWLRWCKLYSLYGRYVDSYVATVSFQRVLHTKVQLS